jgi:hypothetical protein
VPAHFTLTALQVNVAIIPTGKHTYAATQATGTLTIYNGSFLTQQLPAHFILTTTDGIEVATDQTVMIPSGNPPNYGIATVSAHAVMAGKQGNIPADAIDQIYGSAMSLKNLIPFTGGLDASTKPFVTADDQEQALKDCQATIDRKTAFRAAHEALYRDSLSTPFEPLCGLELSVCDLSSSEEWAGALSTGFRKQRHFEHEDRSAAHCHPFRQVAMAR